jgi:hypothetical protein
MDVERSRAINRFGISKRTPDNQPMQMKTQDQSTTAHERAVAIIERLIADKRQAEKEIVENFHTDPMIQAAVAELKRRRDERGTVAI